MFYHLCVRRNIIQIKKCGIGGFASGKIVRFDFACHYRTSALPARWQSRHDKARSGSAVQTAERGIMTCLRHQKFYSVHEVNHYCQWDHRLSQHRAR